MTTSILLLFVVLNFKTLNFETGSAFLRYIHQVISFLLWSKVLMCLTAPLLTRPLRGGVLWCFLSRAVHMTVAALTRPVVGQREEEEERKKVREIVEERCCHSKLISTKKGKSLRLSLRDVYVYSLDNHFCLKSSVLILLCVLI